MKSLLSLILLFSTGSMADVLSHSELAEHIAGSVCTSVSKVGNNETMVRDKRNIKENKCDEELKRCFPEFDPRLSKAPWMVVGTAKISGSPGSWCAIPAVGNPSTEDCIKDLAPHITRFLDKEFKDSNLLGYKKMKFTLPQCYPALGTTAEAPGTSGTIAR